ncbi:MAG TPA: hypothetical protein VLC93_01755, partial [Myxococcota bacterium]|nr:hypothetical protein [Myxococcota bacterium]
MRQRGAVLIALVTACGVDLPLRDDVTYTCRTSADCPLELSCAVAIQSCVADLDTIAPRLTSITTSNRQTVILVFDEAVDHDLAALPSTFIIVRDDGQPLEVLAAAPLEDGKSIVLRTGTQRGAAVYTLETSITDAQGNLATLDQETFTGFGSAPDSTPPQTIAPVDASVMVVPPPDRDDLTVILAWTPRSGAINYTVEVSSKATFDPIDMTIEVRGDESSQVLRVVEGTTYFWRVRSDATVPGEFGSASFTILFDTVYVYCPVGTACRAGDGVGSKNVPLASVARAITLATDRALPTIAVAARGNDAGGNVATYDEPISITGAGRTIVGGYDGSFAGPPNRAINRARIAYELGVLTVTQNTGVITIDKLELEATLTNEVAPPTQELVTATMSELGADVVFTDCLITTADTNDGGTPETTLPAATLALAAVNIGTAAVRLDAATTVTAGRAFRSTTAALSLNGHLVVEGSHLTARRVFDSNAGASSVGLAAVGGIVEVVDALIEAGNFVPTIGFPSGAVNVLNTAGAIRRSTIVSGDGGARGNGVVVLGLTNDLLELTGNTVVVTSAIENGTGIIW